MTIDATLRGRVALVTGGGRGIGRAHALALAAAGAAVVVNDVGRGVDGTGEQEPVAAAVVAEIEEAGGQAVADTSDVSAFAGAESAVAMARDRFGSIDIVVNNAGILGGGPVTEIDIEQMDRMFAVHLGGAVGTIRAALPSMRERGWGRIVNTVSEVALTARPGAGGGFVYAAAKAAVWSMTLSIAEECRGTGITVNGISPGARTRMSSTTIDDSAASSALNLDPAFVAVVVRYLAGDDASDITGQIIHVAGGHVREYLPVRRTANTALVARLSAIFPQQRE